MVWPWVSRETMNRELSIKSAAMNELRLQLAKSEDERRAAQLMLLRATQGLPIFADAQPVKQEVTVDSIPVIDPSSMPEREVNDMLVREAMLKGFRHAGAMTGYINKRKEEIYASSQGPSAEDERLKRRALESLEASVTEGYAAAVGGK